MSEESFRVSVRLFARARDLVGADRVDVELPPAARVADLRSALARSYPQLHPVLPALLIAVGNDYARDDAAIPADCEVACFPPVSGG